MKKLLIICLAVLAGCSKPQHTAEHAINLGADADYAADLEICFQKAIGEYQDGGSVTKVNSDYEACHAMADQVAGRKK